MAERILSNDEIAEMEKLTVDRLVEAIDRGDREGAKKLARRMYNEFLSMHDLYRNWTSATLSFVGRRFGDKALEEAMDEGVKAWWGPSLDKMPQDVRARVKMFAAGLRGHLQPLHIEEDDEKVVIQMRPCGSGGRLVLEGKYEGPDALLTVKGKQFLTYGRDSFPGLLRARAGDGAPGHRGPRRAVRGGRAGARDRQGALQLHHLQGSLEGPGQVLRASRPEEARSGEVIRYR